MAKSVDLSDADEWVVREGLIFRFGDYPDVGFGVTPEEYAGINGDLAEIPIAISGADDVPPGGFGHLIGAEVRGDELHGTVRLPKWLDEALDAGKRKVQCRWDRETKRLDGLCFVPESPIRINRATPTPSDIGGSHAHAGRPTGGTAPTTRAHQLSVGESKLVPDEREREGDRKAEAERTATEVHEVEDTPVDDAAELRRDLERSKSQLAKANADAKRNRERLEELEEAERKREESKLGETEKARRREAEREQKAREVEQRATEAERLLRLERIANAVEREAIKQGFLEPDLVPRLIDDALVTFEEDGSVVKKSVREAVEKLAKERPRLVDASTRGGTPPRDNYKSPQYRGDGRDRGQETPEQEAQRRRVESGEYARM